ncbi:MAG: hypothetical protein E7006_04080 [Alphaproteobacteria bacterium]|nr:hypothetical protein [Alphaproteobacteria bacterium]
MKRIFNNFYWFFACCTAFLWAGELSAAQMPNPRSASVTSVSGARNSSDKVVTRGNGGAVVSRSATGANNSRVAARSASDSRMVARSGANVSNRSAMPAVNRSATVARSAAARGLPARNASLVSDMGIMRAATRSRATAVFDDISKIGGGYAKCREAYATCMDQFCAKSNDEYRRCYCSSRFIDFRDTKAAFDQAMTLLAQFEDNNLNAVDKTAAEVDAMYSATVGEAAIKRDTSGAQSVLNEIGDLLSGKKKVNNDNSMGLIELDFSTSMDDIWGGGGSSIFDSDSGTNISELEGVSLYNAANKQCLEIIADSCESSAILNMSTSAYNIMITQDCNAYEKVIETQRDKVEQTVRQAEKYLREARLEEYRAHNSADVNECVDKVRAAILADTACGANYNRCLDFSGLFINQSTGEPIYGPQLFKLAEQIELDGSSDVVGKNSDFSKFLDTKRLFANSALDTCRDNADLVWNEFKRTAIIEIAQAQDEKIEEVKMSCVSTMKECYDTQSGALKSFDDTSAQVTGALSAAAARDMCKDKVIACAALYGDSDSCKFDKSGRFDKKASTDKCGLQSLLNFVNVVDETRIAEGCESALQSYANELCTPTTTGKSGTTTAKQYPWKCRLMKIDDGKYNEETGAVETKATQKSLKGILDYRAETVCRDINEVQDNLVGDQIDTIISDISEQLGGMLKTECESMGATWYDGQSLENNPNIINKGTFNSGVFVGEGLNDSGLGYCINDPKLSACLGYNDGDDDSAVAIYYDMGARTCKFTTDWLQEKCTLLGGEWQDDAMCYIRKH